MFINYDIKRYLRSIVMILKGFSSNNLKNSDSSIFDVVNVRQCLFIIITFGIWALANLSCASRISIMITHSPHSLFLSLSHSLTCSPILTHSSVAYSLSIYVSLSLSHTHTLPRYLTHSEPVSIFHYHNLPPQRNLWFARAVCLGRLYIGTYMFS